MLHRGMVAAVAMLLLLAPASAALAGNVNLIVGRRSLDDDQFYRPIEDQTVTGVNVDWAPEAWPVSLQFGFYLSSADDTIPTPAPPTDVEVKFQELSFGLVRIWEGHKLLHPYLGGGLSAILADYDTTRAGVPAKADDDTFGFFINGGLYLRFAEKFNVGIDARVLGLTDLDFEGKKSDADYLQLGLLLGWHW